MRRSPRAATFSSPAKPDGGCHPAGCTSLPVTPTRRPRSCAVALGAFFLPRRAVDPFGAISSAAFDSYALLPVSVTDPVGNLTISINDYRVLTAATVTDANGNRVSAAFDVLGEVTAMAVTGKASETAGDLLDGLRRRSGRRDAAGPVRRPARRPRGDPGQRHCQVRLRPRRLPAHCLRRAAIAAGRLRPGSRDPRLRSASRVAASDQVPAPLQLLRWLRPQRPGQGARLARAALRWRAGRLPALGRVRLDDLRQQGPGGPAVRAVLLRHERLRVRGPGWRQHRGLLRPARPRGGDAASRRQLGEGGVRAMAGAALGPRRHRG